MKDNHLKGALIISTLWNLLLGFLIGKIFFPSNFIFPFENETLVYIILCTLAVVSGMIIWRLYQHFNKLKPL